MRLAVIDDHPLVFDALATIVEAIPGDHRASGYPTLEAFEAAVEAGERPDLVMLDLGLPGTQGLSALERYRDRYDEIPVVVLSASSDRDTILRALDLGAMGFVPKTSRREILIGAIELVASGGIYIPPEALSARGAAPAGAHEETAPAASRGPAGGLGGLTMRQRDVLMLLIKGMPNKAICRQLDL
jgi:DNA-binding NarL/FixJ family response regulator